MLDYAKGIVPVGAKDYVAANGRFGANWAARLNFRSWPAADVHMTLRKLLE